MRAGSTAVHRVQHSANKNFSKSSRPSAFAVYHRNVRSRRIFTTPSRLSRSRWCERVEGAISSSVPKRFRAHGCEHVGVTGDVILRGERHKALIPYFHKYRNMVRGDLGSPQSDEEFRYSSVVTH